MPRTKKKSRSKKIKKKRENPLQRLPKIEVSSETSASYRQECLALCETSHSEQVAKIENLYRPKIKAADNSITKEEIEQDYHGALADEMLRYDSTKKTIEAQGNSQEALIILQGYAQLSHRRFPPQQDLVASHEFVQYLHRTDDKLLNLKDVGLCFLVIGLIALVIGAVFFFLSFQLSSESYGKVLKPDSFEFVVSLVGLTLGGISTGYGLFAALAANKRHKAINVAILHFRTSHRLFQ